MTMTEPDRDRHKEEVIRQICEIKRIEPEEFDMESRFVEDLEFDSLDLFEMVANLEEEYDVPIPDEDLAEIRTVQDAIDVVDRKAAEMAKAGGAGEPDGQPRDPSA